MALTKTSETTAEETIEQPPIVIEHNLDGLIAEKASAENQVATFTARVAELDKKIADIRALGIKTKAEVEVERQEEIIN